MIIGEANERGRAPMWLREDKTELNMDARLDIGIPLRRRNVPKLPSLKGTSETISGTNDDESSLSPRYFHGERSEYVEDYTEYVKKQLKRQRKQQPRIVKRQIPDSREFRKIGENRYNPSNKYPPRREKLHRTGESGFPLLKDSLTKEMIREERKKRYADELRQQMAEDHQRRRSRLPNKVTSSQEVAQYLRESHEHWYEFNPLAPRERTEAEKAGDYGQIDPPYLEKLHDYDQGAIPRMGAYQQQRQQGYPQEQQRPPQELRMEYRENPGPQNMPPQPQGQNPYPDDQGYRNEGYPEPDTQDNRGAAPQNQPQYSQYPPARVDDVKPEAKRGTAFQAASRISLVEKYRMKKANDELKDEVFFDKYFEDGKAKDTRKKQREHDDYIDELQRQIEEDKDRKKKEKMKRRMDELAAEERYLEQLKRIEMDALQENEKKLQQAMEVQELNRINMEKKTLEKIENKFDDAPLALEIPISNPKTNITSSQRQDTIGLSQNLESHPTEPNQPAEPQARPEGSERVLLNEYDEKKELIEEENKLRKRNLTYRETQVEEQKRLLQLNNNILYQQLIDLRAQKVYTEQLKTKAFNNLDMVKRQVGNLRKEQIIQLSKLKKDLYKNVQGTTSIISEPFKYQVIGPDIYKKYNDRHSLDQNVNLEAKSEMVPIDFSKSGPDIIEYYDQLPAKEFQRQKIVDGRLPANKGYSPELKMGRVKSQIPNQQSLDEMKGKSYDQLVDDLIKECQDLDKVKLGIKETVPDRNIRNLDRLVLESQPSEQKIKRRSTRQFNDPYLTKYSKPASVKTPKLLKYSDYGWDDFEKEYQKARGREKNKTDDRKKRDAWKNMKGDMYVQGLTPSLSDVSKSDKITSKNIFDKVGDNRPVDKEDTVESDSGGFDPDALYDMGKGVAIGRHVKPGEISESEGEKSKSDGGSDGGSFDPDKMYSFGKELPVGRFI